MISHEAAAFVIARRAQRYSESLVLARTASPSTCNYSSGAPQSRTIYNDFELWDRLKERGLWQSAQAS